VSRLSRLSIDAHKTDVTRLDLFISRF